MDYYMNENNVVNRLIQEWKEHGQLIIAYDYDGTVFDYANKGEVYNNVIELLQECEELGAYCIVFTCCDEEKYDSIKEYLQSKNIPYDGINENIDTIPFTGRKIYYNILLDDRAGLKSAYETLRKALGNICLDNIINNKANLKDIIKGMSSYKIKSAIEVLNERLERLYRKNLYINSEKNIDELTELLIDITQIITKQ